MSDLSSTDPQMRVDAEADAIVRNHRRAIEPDATEDERITRADIYDIDEGTFTRYMIGGGGPTSHLVLMPDMNGDTMVLIEVHGWSERAVRAIYGQDAAKIARAYKRAQREIQ